MKHYLSKAEEVLQTLNAGADGLTSGEALKRQEECGKNKLEEAK